MRADRCRRWAWWLGARGGGYRARGRRAPSAPKSKLEPLGKEKVKLPFPIWFGHGHVPAPERHTELRDLTHLRTSCARPPWRSSARAWPCSAAVRTAGQRLLELGLVPDRRAARRRRRCPARMNEGAGWRPRSWLLAPYTQLATFPYFFRTDTHAWVALKERGCHARPFFTRVSGGAKIMWAAGLRKWNERCEEHEPRR